MDSATNNLVNLHFENKQPSVAALTLSFATRAQIVPEDGIDLNVNLELKNAAPEEAVKKFAKALYRNWDSLYVQLLSLEPGARGEIDPEVRRASARLEALPRSNEPDLRRCTSGPMASCKPAWKIPQPSNE